MPRIWMTKVRRTARADPGSGSKQFWGCLNVPGGLHDDCAEEHAGCGEGDQDHPKPDRTQNIPNLIEPVTPRVARVQMT